MARTARKKAALKLEIWKKDGDLFSVTKKDLLAAIAQTGKSDEDLKRQMGFGYRYIGELLKGKKIEVWAANYVEYWLRQNTPLERAPIKN